MNDKPQPLIGSIAVAVGGKLIGKAFDKALDKALDKATDKLVARPDIAVESIDKPAVKEEVRREVVKELAPVVENMSNSEPLWRSKVLWTAIGTLATSVAGIGTLWSNGTPDEMTAYVALATTAVTSLGTIWSRVFPSKALGR